MATVTRDPARTWEELQTRLAGCFTARLHGLLAPEISLSGPAGEFGRLRSRGHSGAEVTAGSLNATVERIGNARYRMLAGGEATLVAEPTDRSADHLEIRIGDQVYGGRASFLRNWAEVHSPEGAEVVRLEGNLTGRRYEVAFDPEVTGALPAAILLLHHTIVHRGRAFRAG